MVNQIVTELMDYFRFWGSPYSLIWSKLFEVFALVLLLIVLLVPIFFVYYIVKMIGDF